METVLERFPGVNLYKLEGLNDWKDSREISFYY